jgi:hypothetical protein
MPGLVAVGLLGVAVAASGSLLADELSAFVVHVPGGGLVRDGQKFVAPWLVVVALAVGTTVEMIWTAARAVSAGGVRLASHTAGTLTAAVVLWPVLTLPSLAFGSAQDWDTADYPDGFLQVADRIDNAGNAGTAVFPWTLYRRYEWNHQVVVLDPWPRLVESRVIFNDDLPLAALTVQGEDPAAMRISEAVDNGRRVAVIEALRDEGVRYVVFHRDQPTSDDEAAFFRGQRPVWAESRLALYDLGPAEARDSPLPAAAGAGLVASATTAVGVLVWWIASTRPLARMAGRQPLRLTRRKDGT